MSGRDLHKLFLKAARGLNIVIEPPLGHDGPWARFAGRPTPLSDVLDSLAPGGTVEDLRREYPAITTAELWDALVFASRVLALIDEGETSVFGASA
jgi:uncharacterized protein (DUF433 family)